MNKDIFSIVSQKYIVHNELHVSLDREQLIYASNSDNGLYLIIFRVLNLKSNTIIYNYIHYNALFRYSLIVFLLARNVLMLNTYKEPGNFLSFLDKDCLSNNTDCLDNNKLDKFDKLSLIKSV